MNRLESDSNYKPIPNNYDPKNDDLKIEDVPLEILELILTNLSGKDFQSTVEVNKNWNVITIDTAKRKVFAIVKDYAKFLGENLSESSKDQKNRLINFGKNQQLPNFVNLKEIKASIDELEKDLLNTLKDLSEEDFFRKNGRNIFSIQSIDPFTMDLQNLFSKIPKVKKLQLLIPSWFPKDQIVKEILKNTKKIRIFSS